MANHLSSIKRIRQNKKSRLRNRYVYKNTRTFLKKFYKDIKISKEEVLNKELIKINYQNLISKLDKLAKKNIIHKNKSSHLKSRLSYKINLL